MDNSLKELTLWCIICTDLTNNRKADDIVKQKIHRRLLLAGLALTILIPAVLPGCSEAAEGDSAGIFSYNDSAAGQDTDSDDAALYGLGNVVDSGKNGVAVTWKLDDKGLLLIGGKGTMGAAINSSFVPWDEKRDSIKTVIIKNGVESVGHFAFAVCTELTSVTLPDTINTIGPNAFGGCSALRTIKLPDSVKSIGIWAFGGCRNLDITIPESVTSIDKEAFLKSEGVTIHGKRGSYAETFANENGIAFVSE